MIKKFSGNIPFIYLIFYNLTPDQNAETSVIDPIDLIDPINPIEPINPTDTDMIDPTAIDADSADEENSFYADCVDGSDDNNEDGTNPADKSENESTYAN